MTKYRISKCYRCENIEHASTLVMSQYHRDRLPIKLTLDSHRIMWDDTDAVYTSLWRYMSDVTNELDDR